MRVTTLVRSFISVVLLAAASLIHPAFADCSFSGGEGGIVTFQIPQTIILDPDTPVGTIIYDHAVESDVITVHCGGADERIRRGYLTLTDADAREDVLPGVYRTNLPGIGIRAAASTERVPVYTVDDLVRPWQYYGSIHGYSDNTVIFRAAAQLVVIGPVQEGDVDTSRLTAQDTLGGAVIGEMRFSPTSVHIATNTCNLADRNIYVPLKTVNAQDFVGNYSDILTDSSFKIAINDCRAGTKVDYQFVSSRSTGLINDNILDIASGDAAAQGLGIQLLDKNNNVLQFDQTYTALTTTQDKAPVEIPLKARYIKMGPIKPGKVEAVATFELFYR
jgi:type 1 fimbria pilin